MNIRDSKKSVFKKRNNKDKKSTIAYPVNEGFADLIREDSKFDKFKPAIKVFVAIILIMTAIYGFSILFSGNDKDTSSNTETYSSSGVGENDDAKLSQCISDAISKNPTPEKTSDSNFYPKIISGYDAQLACYDQYPNADSAAGRSSIESARKNAVDSSNKDNYSASSGANSGTQQSTSSNSTSTSTPSNSYDPSKCEPYNDEAKRWREEADVTYATIQQIMDGGSGVSDALMNTWKDQLDKGNKAYAKYQECRASL